MKSLPAFLLIWSVLTVACQSPGDPTAPSSHSLGSRAEMLSSEDSLLLQKLDGDSSIDHATVMNHVLGKPIRDIRTVGILVYDGVNDLDMMGPRYVLGQLIGASTELVATQPGTIKTVMGVEVIPDNIIDSVSQLDILVIPGGFRGTIEAAYDKELHDWIRAIDQHSVYTSSVCTGAWVLGATGLLKGKRATTNWYRAEEMLEKYGATFTNERYTQAG